MEAVRNTVYLILLSYLSAEVCSQSYVEEDINKLSRANTFFANELYKQLSKDSVNLVFSPISISVALSMLNVGASGTTSQELNSTLGFTLAQISEHELLEGYQTLVTSLPAEREGYQFSLANAHFLQNSFPLYSNYTTRIAEDFRAVIRTVDFSDTEGTLAEINGWVSTETNGKIPSVLKEVSSSDVMAIVNAVYFKGQWLHQFDHENTFETDFFTADGTRKLVNMMWTEHSVKYNPNHAIGGAVMEYPYKENAFSMIFMLPELGSSLEDLEKNLTPEILMQLPQDLQSTNLTVGIPKLNVESSINLIPHLEAMGIREIFGNSADFSRMTSSALKITEAVHSATMEWTEEGSEAAASTVLTASRRNIRFWLNRPFMFFLRHNPTGVYCFMGKITDV